MTKDLREQRAKIVKDAQAELDRLSDDTPAQERGEIEARFDQMMGQADTLKRQIDDLERRDRLGAAERELSAFDRPPHGGGELVAGGQAGDGDAISYRQAFRSYLAHGTADLMPEARAVLRQGFRSIEQRAQTVGTSTAGGYAVPEEFAGEYAKFLADFGGIRSLARGRPTPSGADMPWPSVDDRANKATIVGEGVASTPTDFVMGSVTLKAFMYRSLITVSLELLMDDGLGLESDFNEMLAERVGRGTGEHFATGNGTTQPQGIVTGAAVGKQGLTGQTTSVIYDDFVDLEHSVDPGYRRSPSCAWCMADGTLKAVKKLKDADGRPLWAPGIAVREPDTILGYRYEIDQDMPAMAADAESIAFGDWSKYIVRDVNGMMVRRLEERFIDQGLIGFIVFSRHDGRLVDSNAIKTYQNSSS